MNIRRILSKAVLGLVLITTVLLVVGNMLGQPVLLGYVTSGSMQPTISSGDGFVAIPAAVAGPVSEGDVIVFRAEEANGGKLTTHRVVEETERGLITKGDNNPFTDQSSGEPPVKRSQVVAVVWQPGGTVLTIPGVGTVVTTMQNLLTTVQRKVAMLSGMPSLLGTQGLAYLLMGFSALAYLVDVLRSRSSRSLNREQSRDSGTSARVLLAVLAGVVVLAATVTMVAPSGPQEFGVVGAESDAPGIGVIETGTNESTQYILGNGGMVPMVTYLEPTTDGVAVQPRENVVPARSTVNATLTLSAPPETGYYRRYVVEHRYLLVLPKSTIRSLYHVHPWLPIAVIDALLGGTFYLVAMQLVGTARVRSKRREGPSTGRRLLNRLP
jgi:signal peptidase